MKNAQLAVGSGAILGGFALNRYAQQKLVENKQQSNATQDVKTLGQLGSEQVMWSRAQAGSYPLMGAGAGYLVSGSLKGAMIGTALGLGVLAWMATHAMSK